MRGYQVPVVRGMELWGIRIGKEQILILAVTLVFMALVQLLLKATRMGKAMRAVADNPMLASVKGIDSEQVIMKTSYIGGVGRGGRCDGGSIRLSSPHGLN
jgi:branched-subunit amino acid ABC-type transport system permease component